ncbi:hybrid sensor histidine kinase/response regulator [Pseudemcibacter aquimaris]|uniref:hybrid sensor histidine kinase/response regulator n=1 Tax=Pseudemcibacter aquimaris TaxID=2857064 RepID=UPI00237E05FE|nr:PAS domain S-box protein [Pseudemcibacter aquimaris]
MLEKAPDPDYSLILRIIGASLIIILLFLLWNYSLRKEISLRKSSEERFKQIAETVDGLFYILKPNMRDIEYISPNFEEWTKFTCEEIYQDPFIWDQILHREDRDFYKNAIERVIKSDYKAKIPDYRIVHKDGTVRWLSSQIHPVYEEGKIKNIIGFSSDITQSKISSSKLDEMSNQFQNAFDYATNGMALISIDGNFLRVNDALCNILDFSEDEMLEKTLMQVTHKDDLKNSMSMMKEVLKGIRPSFELEERYVRADNSIVPVQFNASLVRDGEGKPKHFVAQFQDLSELKEREDQLRHSQKMDAVGQLTGGIAHDFNNILGIILGNLEILDSTIEAEAKQKSRLQKAIKSVDRGSNLIKKLLSFSRNSSPQRAVTNVNDCIRIFQDSMSKSLGHTIQFETSLLENLWPAEIDESEFEDAVLNICLNARDAMPNGGSFTIKTENVVLNEQYVERVSDSKIGDHILISFTDTGEGIAPAIKDKVLEPFFTTKSVNKGTGLGLSMVHGFAQRTGGHLRIHSEIGVGTTINLYIPRSYRAFEADEEVREEQVLLPTGKEKILVLDDEENLCEVAENQLKNLGYSVFAANDSKTAIDILKKNSDIELLFSDIVMPDDDDGYKVSQIARELNPSIKILLTSGYSDNVEVDVSGSRIKEELKRSVLAKPYSHHELAFAVRRTLDR